MSYRRISLVISVFVSLLLIGILYTNGSHIGINYGDGQDLILAAASGGLAHPPGYPILVNLYRLLHMLIPALSWGIIGALISAVSLGLAAGIAAHLIQEYVMPKQLTWWQRLCLSWSLVLSWIVAPHIWIFGLLPEIMPFTLLLISLFGLSIAHKQDFFIGLIASLLVLFHVLTLGLVVVGLGYYVYVQRPRKRFLMMGTVIGIVITAICYSLLLHPISYGWKPPTSGFEWWQFWTRASYDLSASAIDMYAHDWNLAPVVKSIGFWWIWLGNELKWWPIILAALGIYSLRKQKNKFLILLFLIFTYGLFLPAYIKAPTLYAQSEMAMWYGVALRERMMYPLFVIILIAAAIGLRFFSNRVPHKSLFSILCLLIGVTILHRDGVGGGNLYAANASSVYAQAVLNPLPSDSVLLVDSDEIFNLLYAQQLTNFRPDLHLVPVNIQVTPDWYGTNHISQNGFSSDPSQFVIDVVNFNLQQNRRVFLYQFEASLLSHLGTGSSSLYINPYGYTLEILKTPPTYINEYDYGLSEQLASFKNIKADNWFKYSQTSLSYIHTQLAYFYARMGAEKQSKFHHEQALSLSYLPATKEQINQIMDLARTKP